MIQWHVLLATLTHNKSDTRHVLLAALTHNKSDTRHVLLAALTHNKSAARSTSQAWPNPSPLRMGQETIFTIVAVTLECTHFISPKLITQSS